MVDGDEEAPAFYGREGCKDARLVGTTGRLYNCTIAATRGAELANKHEIPRAMSLVDKESNYFRSAQWCVVPLCFRHKDSKAYE